MRVSKVLVNLVGVCLIPIAGLMFVQKADAYQLGVGRWPVKPASGKCTTFINVSSSGRDSWYWEVECGRNHSRKSYNNAKRACLNDYNGRGDYHPEHFGWRGDLIKPYAHNKCY
jgi:hypothetical protein